MIIIIGIIYYALNTKLVGKAIVQKQNEILLILIKYIIKNNLL